MDSTRCNEFCKENARGVVLIQEIVFYSVFIICWLLCQIFGNYVGISWAFPILTALWFLFEKCGWKILPAWLVKQYKIYGDWSGKLYYHYKGKDGIKDIRLTIKQSFLKTEICIKTDEMLGKSIVSKWCLKQDKLLYIYNTDPNSEVKDKNPIQWGAAQIKIDPNDLNKLRIEYWTDRQTKGHMELKKDANE